MIREAYEKVKFLLEEGIPKNYVETHSNDEHKAMLSQAGLAIPSVIDMQGVLKSAQFCWNSLGEFTSQETSLQSVQVKITLLLVHKKLLGLSFAAFVPEPTKSEAEAKEKIIRKISDGLDRLFATPNKRPRTLHRKVKRKNNDQA